MLLPEYWLRQKRLQRALHDYPIYDPPHKTEERLLPKDNALENFKYFVHVRLQRVEFFNNWLRSHFGVEAGLDQKGVENALDWATDYMAVLMTTSDFLLTSQIVEAYVRPWRGEYVGANAYFDLGAMLGEAIIRQRPNLRWQMEWSLADYPNVEQTVSKPTMAMLRSRERDIRESKRDKWSGYRRPLLASADKATDYVPVYGYLSTYSGQEFSRGTVEYKLKNLHKPKGLRFPAGTPYLKDMINLALNL